MCVTACLQRPLWQKKKAADSPHDGAHVSGQVPATGGGGEVLLRVEAVCVDHEVAVGQISDGKRKQELGKGNYEAKVIKKTKTKPDNNNTQKSELGDIRKKTKQLTSQEFWICSSR